MIDRHALGAVQEALSDTRAVVLLGARQVGKSTLLAQIAEAESAGRRIMTFDDQATRSAATADPAGFIAALEPPVALDEVQRVPAVMTEIKLRVDSDWTPGQFLITGSANLLEMSQVKESLAGRAEYLRLYPFSQGELGGSREGFVPGLKAGAFPHVQGAPVGRRAYAEIIAKGGYPEAQSRTSSRRDRFFESYIEGLIDTDLFSLADVADRAGVARLLRAVGAISAGELNVDGLSNSMNVPASTLRRHADLLEMLFLIRRIPPWSHNLLSRTIKRPKVYVTDSGLLTYLVGADAHRIETDLRLGGSLFESFVTMELNRQISWQLDRPTLHHFRDRAQREVDIVIEHSDGSVTGVEVKAAATVTAADFRGLAHLRDKLGTAFKAGALVYTGASTVAFGDKLAAVPLSGLWH